MLGWRRTTWSLAFLLAGCLHPVAQQADLTVSELLSRPLDSSPPAADALTPSDPHQAQCALLPPKSSPDKGVDVTPARFEQKAKTPEEPKPAPPGKGPRRLAVPADLPGAGAKRAILPPTTAPAKEREAAINKLFPPLPPLPSHDEVVPGPDGHPLTLSDLQRMALNHSPLIRQAVADVEAAKGAVIQSAAYPNPITGWAQDEVGTANHGPSELGFFVGQTFVLGGKLTLARAMAQVDLQNAELALKKAQADVAGQVRANYFAVLVADKNFKVSRALAQFTNEIYRVQVDQVKLTQAAAYEPRQIRVFTLQARNNLVAARNRSMSAWRQLAATIGVIEMPATELAGSVDMAVPLYRYDASLIRILQTHTDVLTAKNVEQKARLGLKKAQVTPIPDVTLNMHVNKFFSENGYVHSLDVQFPIPLYDRNRGGIMQAQGNLMRAVKEAHRVQTDLTAKLADAFERYNANRQILQEFRDYMLTDQVEAYLGAFERHQQEPDKVGFGDVVAAQQALATTITTYVSTLGNLWQAVADMSTLLQTDDLFRTDETEQWPEVPELGPMPRHGRDQADNIPR